MLSLIITYNNGKSTDQGHSTASHAAMFISSTGTGWGMGSSGNRPLNRGVTEGFGNADGAAESSTCSLGGGSGDSPGAEKNQLTDPQFIKNECEADKA